MKFFTASLLAIAMAETDPAATTNKKDATPAVTGTCAAKCEEGEKCMIKDTTDGCPDFEFTCPLSTDAAKQEEECKAMVGCKFVPKVEEVAGDENGDGKKPEVPAKCEKDADLIKTFKDKECECKTSSATRNLAVVGVTAMVALLI